MIPIFSIRRRSRGAALLVGLRVLAPDHRAAADTWRFTPSLSVQEVYDTNTTAKITQPADLVSEVIPAISVKGDTAYSSINLSYSPSYNHYLFHTSPDNINQNMNGTGSLTPFPDYLTIDISTNASQTASGGNFISSQGVLVPSQNRLLYYIGKIAPHFSRRFSNDETIDAYYRVQSVNTSDEGYHPGTPSLSNSQLDQNEEISLSSGQRFGGTVLGARVYHDESTGTGGSSSSSATETVQGQYHFDHTYAATATVGYQSTHYGASPGILAYTQDTPTWTLGGIFTPNEMSSLSVSYGLQQGIYTPTVDMTYIPDALTVVKASYIVTIQNQLQAVAQTLQYLTYDALGNPIDSRTGLPFNLVNQTFGSQTVLFRDKPALLTVSHQFVRSGVSFTLSYEVRESVSGIPSRDSALGGSISYFRAMTPLLSGSITIGYTDHTSTGVASTPAQRTSVENATVSLSYTIGEKTSATLSETFNKATSSLPTSDSLTNQVLVGIRRDF